MKTNKIPLPSFIDAECVGTVSINMEFEQGATINYNLFFKPTEVVNSDKYELGVSRFSALGYVFKLGNSNLQIDPINNKKNFTASFKAVSLEGMSSSDGSEEDENKNPFEVMGIGSTNKTIETTDITDILSLEVNYASNDVMDWKYDPTYLAWGSNNNDDNPYTSAPIYERIPQPERIVVNDPENAIIAPDVGKISDFTMNYDVSGVTKTKETNTYRGTVLRKKQVQIYGYTYLSDDVGDIVFDQQGQKRFQFNSASLSSYWGLVQEYTINYNYDPNSGYYLGYDKFGRKKVRYAPEENFEILELESADDAISAAAFRFFWTPIIEYERLELEAYYNYYDDTLPTASDIYNIYEEWDQLNERYVWKKSLKKDYVIPRFVKRQLTYSRCFSYTIIDPAHYLQDRPPTLNKILSTGEENKTLTDLNILVGDKTLNVEDSYEVLTETISCQDSDFKNYTKNTSSESNFGRPPQADYVQIWQEQEPVEQNNNQERPGLTKYIVKKAGTNLNRKKSIGSVSYEKASSAIEAFSMLKQDLRKQMLFNGDQFTVTCLYNPTIKPNNSITCSYKEKVYRGIVKSVNHNIEIIGRNTGKGFTTITVGIENVKNSMWSFLQLTQDTNSPDNGLGVVIPISKPDTIGKVDEVFTLVESLPKRGGLLT